MTIFSSKSLLGAPNYFSGFCKVRGSLNPCLGLETQRPYCIRSARLRQVTQHLPDIFFPQRLCAHLETWRGNSAGKNVQMAQMGNRLCTSCKRICRLSNEIHYVSVTDDKPRLRVEHEWNMVRLVSYRSEICNPILVPAVPRPKSRSWILRNGIYHLQLRTRISNSNVCHLILQGDTLFSDQRAYSHLLAAPSYCTMLQR